MKSNNVGYYAAINAAIEYEVERGRPALPKANIGLMKHLSEARGSASVGACLAADEITGSHLPASELRKAHDQGVWIDFHSGESEWYVSDEKIK